MRRRVQQLGAIIFGAGLLSAVPACSGPSAPASGAAHAGSTARAGSTVPGSSTVPASSTTAAPASTAASTTTSSTTGSAVTTGSGSSTTSAGAAPAKSLAGFPTPVAQALEYLQSRTSEPLAGPTNLDTSARLSATATVTAHGWSVGLYACQHPEPVNSPAITSCEDAASTKGTFGETTEPSPAAAVAALPGIVSVGGPGSPMRACPAGSPVSVVVNQRVSTCGAAPGAHGGPSTASWHEGDWTFVFSLGGGQTAQQATAPLIRLLNRVSLPPATGWFGVDEGGDGEHSTAAWVQGSHVFSDFDYHSAPGAADMAASTRALPG